MTDDRLTAFETAQALARLYEEPFAGKQNGRFRISSKNLRRLTGRRRISDAFVRELEDEMFDMGYVVLDMETFFAVTSARIFAGYRRAGDALINTSIGQKLPPGSEDDE